MKRIFILLALLAAPSFAQKTYSELLMELRGKAQKDELKWSDLGELVDIIETESEDTAYRASLCEITLFYLDSHLPNAEAAYDGLAATSSRVLKRARNRPPTNANLNLAILQGDLVALIRNIVNNAHRSNSGGDTPFHAVMRAKNKSKWCSVPGAFKLAETEEEIDIQTRAQMIRLFLLLGVDVNRKGNDGLTPLLLAIRDWPALAPLLLEGGADVSATDEEGNGVFVYLGRSKLKSGTSDLLSKILRLKPGVNPIYATGPTLLARLAMFNKADLVRELLANGAHPWLMDSDGLGRNVLHWAVIMGAVDVVEVLLEFFNGRADKFEFVNFKDASGMTPLMLAFSDIPAEILGGTMEQGVRNARMKIARLLGAAGAVATSDAKTPLQLAIFLGLVELIDSMPESMRAQFSDAQKMDLLLLALGRLPDVLSTEGWEKSAASYRHKRQKVFLSLWNAFRMQLTFEQVEMLEVIAAANGFDIILEYLLELKAYPQSLSANQKFILLLQLMKPLPGVFGEELREYRNARRRIFENVLTTNAEVVLTVEQIQQIEERALENGFDDFLDLALWQAAAEMARRTDQETSSRARSESRAARLIRKISSVLLPRKLSGTSSSSSSSGEREAREKEENESDRKTPRKPSGGSIFDLTKPPGSNRDDHDRSGGGFGASIL